MRGKRDTRIDRDRFPIDPWRLVDRDVTRSSGLVETLFAVGNGFIGVRAAPLDGSPGDSPGVIVNGFHETWPIEYPENAYGLARVGQSVVSAPDASTFTVSVDAEPLLGAVEGDGERTIDFRTGVLTRESVHPTPGGGRVQIRSKLFVSVARRHVLATRLSVTALDRDVTITVDSPIRNRQDERISAAAQSNADDPRRGRVFGHRVLEWQLDQHESLGDPSGLVTVGYRCVASGMSIACTQRHVVDPTTWSASDTTGLDRTGTILTAAVAAGSTVVVTKIAASATSATAAADELAVQTGADVDEAVTVGWDQLLDEQRRWYDAFWSSSDIAIEGDPAAQQAVRWNLFQLAQATARTGALGVAAKGVSAGGYDGHYFWDTEIYVIPFLAAIAPRAARQLLEFRAAMLPAARRRAAEMDQRGALYPWRTITGEEASAYYPAGTAQYHIDAAIAHAVDRYVAATGDTGFLVEHGAEMLAEIARLFADLGVYDHADPPGFHLHGVTGPDEYTAVVDDNLYTNVMARFSLRLAADAIETVQRIDPARHAELVERIGLERHEIAEWRRAADAMHIGYDVRRGIHPQDAAFLSHARWDFENVPAHRYPLLLNFHPLVIYRHQVLKQADVVMAMFLRGESFDPDDQRRNFDYYDALTTGDSSLSACVQSIVAAQVGHLPLALDYFEQSLYLDLADTHRNTNDGVHIANAGGVWAALVHGFGGVRDTPGALRVSPRLPAGWDGLRFRLRRSGADISVAVDCAGAVVTVLSGECPVANGDAVTVLAAGESLRLDGA
jgi:alpha,alpha-trehalose phosphorylase